MIDFKKFKVDDIIPHSPPMVLLERVSDCDELSLTAVIHIEENCMFFDQQLNGVAAYVGIEYMAQAIAAYAGIHSKSKDEAIKLGFLLGTRKYKILEKVFKVNHRYQISINRLYVDDSGLSSFKCTIFDNQQIIVESQLNVFETNDLSQVINKENGK